jgi:hypothetical protein
MAGDVGRVRAAVAAVARELDRLRFPYMVIGGVAVTVWGEPRLTQDVDVTIATSSNETETIDQLVRAFTPRTSDPAEFVRRTRVLPVTTSGGVNVDVLFAGVPYERTAIERTVTLEVAGHPVRVCTPEEPVILASYTSLW